MKKYLFMLLIIVGIVIYLLLNLIFSEKVEITLLSPYNNENNVFIQPTLEWDVKTQYKSNLVYEVYIGDSTETMNSIVTTNSTSITLDETLDYSKKYYWYVKVYHADPENILSTKESNYIKSSKIYSFKTMKKPNFNMRHKKITNNINKIKIDNISKFVFDEVGNIILDGKQFFDVFYNNPSKKLRFPLAFTFNPISISKVSTDCISFNSGFYESNKNFLNRDYIQFKAMVYFINSNDVLKINKLVLTGDDNK